MEKLFMLKLFFINVIIIILGVFLFLTIMRDYATMSDVKFGTICGTIGAPIIGLISLEIKLIFDYLKHRKELK